MLNKIYGLLWLLGLLLVLLGCNGNSGATDQSGYESRQLMFEVKTEPVRLISIRSKMNFSGNLLPRRRSRVVSQVDGIVSYVPPIGAVFNVEVNGEARTEQLGITYGQVVQKDDVIVRLDTHDEEVALQIAQAKLEKAKADLAELQAWERPEEVARLVALRDEAKARYEHALRNHQRMSQLANRNAVSASEVDQAETTIATAKATLDGTEAVLKQAQAGPTQYELAVLQAAVAQAEAEVQQHTREIEKATIRAPFDGVVTSFDVELGERVAPAGEPLAEIMDLRYLVAEIAVPEIYVGQVQVRDEASVKAAGADSAVPGLIVAVNQMVDYETRTFSVRVAIDNSKRQFKAGQFATVTLSFGERETERMVIPNRAIVYLEGAPHVYIVADDRAVATPIETGLSNDEFTEVIIGLTEADQVIVDDPTLLADGMKVTVFDKDAESIQ